MTDTLPPPIWVDEPEILQQAAIDLASQPRLAVDTESNSLHAFHEQVCLVQFSTPTTDYLVDPLYLPDLASLAPLFADPKIEKIFHAAEYDMICLKRDFGFEVCGIFDTMQSARILGYPQVGLDSLLGLKFGLEVDKRYQKADWADRPLSPEMLNYARLDTHHLFALRDVLQAELVAMGRWELACEEFIRLSKLDGNGKTALPSWRRVSGAQKFDSRQLAILKELCDWRDQTAERLARPPFKVVDDHRLAAITLAAPTKAQEIKPLLTEHQFHRFGAQLLQAYQRGLTTPGLTRPRPIRACQDILDRSHALGQWRKKVAEKMKIESDLILPKAWMQAIAEKDPHDPSELVPLMPDSPWRHEMFANEILKAIHAPPEPPQNDPDGSLDGSIDLKDLKEQPEGAGQS